MMVVERLKQLVASERKITAQIIEHIQEIEQKKIHVQLGFPTMFAFLTLEIGYSASAAQRRIEASRIITSVPEVKEELKSGSLNLSQVALVAQSIRQKQKETPSLQIKTEDKKELLMSIKNQSFEASQRIVSQGLDLEIKSFDRKIVQKDESVRLEVTFTKEQMEAFEKVKGLMSHVNPSASVAEVFEHMAKYYLQKKGMVGKSKTINDSDRVGNSNAINACVRAANGAAIKSSASITESVMENRGRENKPVMVKQSNSLDARKAIPTRVKRIVWTRDEGKCQHFNPTTGRSCGSKYLLEYDHIKRHRHGGDDNPSNLRLLCKAHNLWRG